MALSDLHEAKTLSELNLSVTADQIEALRKLDSNGAVVEEYLAILSAKMDNGDSLEALCSTHSLLVLFGFLIIDYARCHDNLLSNPTQNVSITHRSYEYVLYILLGIAEKSAALRSLVNCIEEDEKLSLESLFASLGRIISSDTFYFTQEMAMEVLGRICFMLLSNQAKDRVHDLVRPLSPLIKIHLTDKKSISMLLRDMRPLLNKVNESNANIITFPVTAITLGNDSITGSSWLDIAKAEMFCFYSEKLEIYLKFPISSVTSCEHSLPLLLEIKISEIPEMYKSVLSSSSPQLVLRISFMDEEDARESIKYFQRSNLHATKREEDTVSSLSSPEMFTEEQILRGQKISITRASKHETINKSMDSLLKLADTVLTKPFLPKSPQAAAQSSPRTTKSTVTSTRKVPAKSGRGRKRKAATIRPVLMRNATSIANQSSHNNGGLPDNLSFEERMEMISPYRENKDISTANKSITGAKRMYGKTSKRKDEPPSLTASVLNARSAKMRSTDNNRKVSVGRPTLNLNKTLEIQGGENEVNKILKTGRTSNNDKVNMTMKSDLSEKAESDKNLPDTSHSFVYDFPTPNRFAEDELPFEPNQPASTKKLPKDEDNASRQSSSYLGKRKYGSANSTPRKFIPLGDTTSHSGPSFEEPKPPSWKRNENIQSAAKEPGTSIKNNRTSSASAFVSTPIMIDNKTPFQQNKFATVGDNTRKRKPLQEILGRNTPVAASVEKEDVQPIPKQSSVNLNYQQPLSRQQSKYLADTELKSKREKQREAMLTLSQQIEAMAPDLNDYAEEGNMGNAAMNNETVSATSFPDESSAALSRILQELQAFQKPSPKESAVGASKQRKQLRNIAASSQDQLHSYIHQVQHYVTFYLKDFDHSLRTNHDTLSYSLSVTVQPQILAQEMKSLTDFEQNTLSQYQDIFARFSALKNNVQDVRTQDRDAAVSFRKSLTQTRHACRSRAVTKLRNASSGMDTNNKTNNKRVPTAADLRSIISGGKDIDIAALLRG